MSFGAALLVGLCLSVSIEALQFVFKFGFSELDDVIHNTLGCMIGYGVYALVTARFAVQVLMPNKLRDWVFQQFARKLIGGEQGSSSNYVE